MRTSLFVIACLAVLIGCGSAPVDTTPRLTANVRVEDNDFNPAAVNLKVGGTVTWQWVGMDYHSVTFTNLNDSTGNPVSSNIVPVGTYQHTFPITGTFNYYCLVHGGAMTGSVTVVN
jgi:plastocyanin